MAFYDFKAHEVPPVEAIVVKPIAFKTWVMKYAISDGDYQVIGHLPLTPDLLEKPPFFKQDPLNGKLSITYDGGDEQPATRKEIEGLEHAAVWEPEHIVDRLNDHFAGQPNAWVELTRPQ